MSGTALSKALKKTNNYMEKRSRKDLLAELDSLLVRKAEIESLLDLDEAGVDTGVAPDKIRSIISKLSTDHFDKLRERAEEKLNDQHKNDQQLEQNDVNGYRNLVHELEVQQVELEIQNEELRFAQEELSLLHAKYSDLYNYAPVGYLTVTREGRIEESNEAANRILGYEPRSLDGKRLPLFIVRENQNDFYDFLRNIIRSSEAQNSELKLRKRDGSVLHCSLRGISVPGADGKFTQYYITLIDISERVMLDEAYRNLIRFSLQGYAIIRPDRVVFANRMISHISGYSLTEIYRFSFEGILNIVAPEFRQFVEEDFFNRIEGKTVENDRFEIQILRKDGSRRWIDIFPILTEYQGENAIQVTMVDITKQKESLFKLEESKQQLQLISDNLPVAVAHYNRDKVCLFANDAYCDIMHISPEDIVGMSLSDILSEKQYADAAEQLVKVFDGDKVSFHYAKEKDGNTVHKEIIYIPRFNESGIVSEYFSILVDITEMKSAENRIRKYAGELKELNITKDKLFSIIAHDLRNPFKAFIDFSDYLRKNSTEVDAESLKTIAEKMYFSASNVYDLIENLLQWSRIQTGRLPFKPQRVSLSVLLDSTKKLFEASADNKKISITLDVDNTLLIYADENMMSTVFRNVLSNAIKYTEDNGNILISTKLESKVIRIIFEDDGIGMTEDTVRQLFSIDEKSSKHGTHGEEGTGLGLILTKELIEKNGGTIQVISEEGRGSTLIVSLPVLED